MATVTSVKMKPDKEMTPEMKQGAINLARKQGKMVVFKDGDIHDFRPKKGQQSNI